MNRSEHACTGVVINYWWVQKLTHEDARLRYIPTEGQVYQHFQASNIRLWNLLPLLTFRHSSFSVV